MAAPPASPPAPAACQAEVEHLKQHLSERDGHIVALEQEFVKSNSRISDLEEQTATWREKYERLYDSHKRVQKLNQVLEDKLLQMVDKSKSDKSQLTKDIATLSVRLAQSKHTVSQLHKENERYKNDMNLAIQLLQCKPDNFVSHKLDNLPVDTQARVSQLVMSKTKAGSPNLLTKNGNGNENETIDSNEYEFNISASLMSKILEDSMQDTVTKHCDTCSCNKIQGNLFSYDETHYSVATQTQVNGEMKNSLCLNCNGEVKSLHSNISNRSNSPLAIRILNNDLRNASHSPGPVFLVPQNSTAPQEKMVKENDLLNDKIKSEDKLKLASAIQKEIVKKIGDDLKELQNNFSIEPTTHHRLCDRTKTSATNNASVNTLDVKINEETYAKEIPSPVNKEVKAKSEGNSSHVDNVSLRKLSHGSAGAISRASSIAKSTASTHKSNTHVGPGPRFCSLRVQAGSKNILLDNAQPDVPPVLYKRQSRCTENILKNDDEIANTVDVDNRKVEEHVKLSDHVVESTLVDVHVDSINKDNVTDIVNPILMNVSASPLQPLKAHSYTNPSESIEHKNNAQVNSIVKSLDLNQIDKAKTDISKHNGIEEKPNPSTNSHGMKIFNFDLYEQNVLTNQFKRQLRKIDMSQLHSIENTKISKDLPPLQPDIDMFQNKPHSKAILPANINVYPNVTQTQIKVMEAKNAVVADQSTSSLSSDDSAALLQKQQLIRVAEWVQKNLEQQTNFNTHTNNEEHVFPHKVRRDSKTKNNENLDIVHKMPHPVTKYSNSYKNDSNNEIQNSLENHSLTAITNPNMHILSNTIVKETVFPVECDVLPITEGKGNFERVNSLDSKSTRLPEDAEVRQGYSTEDKKITPEELARMEYNVKKFLLSGSQCFNPGANTFRSRRTSSKTETDL